MYGLLLKKTFFDMWDNLFSVLAINLGFLLIFIVSIVVTEFSRGLVAIALSNTLPIFTILRHLIINSIFLSLIFIYLGAACAFTKELTEKNKPGFGDFFRYLKTNAKGGCIFGFINAFLIFILVASRQTYYNSVFGIFVFYLMLWLYFLWIASSQYFFPLLTRFDKNVYKNIKKMLMLLLDNFGLTIIGLVIPGVIIMVLYPVTMFLAFGPATLMLMYNIALTFLLHRYEYLEENPEKNRKKIPWQQLLIEEEKKVGKRTLKGFFFPWKE